MESISQLFSELVSLVRGEQEGRQAQGPGQGGGQGKQKVMDIGREGEQGQEEKRVRLGSTR